MSSYESEQAIGQLEKIKGGYYYLRIEAEIIDQFERKRHTRLVCHLDNKINFQCGLNHLGDSNFFIIVAGKYLEQLGKKVGSTVSFKIEEDPNPLGVEVPEVLTVLLDQDENLKAVYDKITDGKKRALIFSILKVKDINKQVESITDFLVNEKEKLMKKGQI
ncbi:MAG TPA: YdeI/OmpD-associated family protein [Saprospiraceae bacterium]|nr:YdeI/OmpD-associated family protein [Saprospiraceae bacterium]HMP24311.1 YdeI/OmpD-associated family protein [Saprospiraceae bacterium]